MIKILPENRKRTGQRISPYKRKGDQEYILGDPTLKKIFYVTKKIV